MSANAQTTNEPSAPAPASFADLKAIPNVTNDFVCDAQGKGLTLEQARDEWMKQLVLDADAAKQAANEAAEKARQEAEDEFRNKSDANLADNGSGEAAYTDPVTEWETRIGTTMQNLGVSREEAAFKVGSEDEDLRFAYVDELRKRNGIASENRKRAVKK